MAESWQQVEAALFSIRSVAQDGKHFEQYRCGGEVIGSGDALRCLALASWSYQLRLFCSFSIQVQVLNCWFSLLLLYTSI